MFSGIDIHLSEPICDCDEQNLAWNTPWVDNKPCLTIECKTCKTMLNVPNSKFMGRFKFERPYPGKVKAAEEPNSENNSNVFPIRKDMK